MKQSPKEAVEEILMKSAIFLPLKNTYKNRKNPSLIECLLCQQSARSFEFIILVSSPNTTLKLNIIYPHFRNEKSKVQTENEVCPS